MDHMFIYKVYCTCNCLQFKLKMVSLHSGIAGKYQNVELLGDLFNYFDLKTLILSNFLSLAADIIFWVMRSMWKCAKKQISHLHIAWVAKVFERWTSYISEMVYGGLFKFQKYVHGGSSKFPFPLFSISFFTLYSQLYSKKERIQSMYQVDISGI